MPPARNKDGSVTFVPGKIKGVPDAASFASAGPPSAPTPPPPRHPRYKVAWKQATTQGPNSFVPIESISSQLSPVPPESPPQTLSPQSDVPTGSLLFSQPQPAPDSSPSMSESSGSFGSPSGSPDLLSFEDLSPRTLSESTGSPLSLSRLSLSASSSSSSSLASSTSSIGSSHSDIPAVDRHIKHALASVKEKYSLGAIGITQRIFDDKASVYEKSRSAYFSPNNNSIVSLLNSIAGTPDGCLKLREWILSPTGKKQVHDIIHDEMDEVTKAEKISGLSEITPEYIANWKVSDHTERAPFMCGILVAAAQTERAKRENTKKFPDVVCRVALGQLAYQRSGNVLGFPAAYGLFLWSCGASHQVIDSAHRMGLSIDYSSIRPLLKVLADHSIAASIEVAKGRHMFGYDNINLSTSIFVEQRGSSTPAKVTSGTFGIVYPLPNANSEAMRLKRQSIAGGSSVDR
ncbi:hypothetical protein DFP72DRAFT_943848 [Ephemerocybe angulata]|uniref:Uncharacterized protein n=1 Tax=Ephemerocybe angulata TaxID=980116 RepID=A0A8H6H8H6_9AGAR|nr:hypothetical protein DFP72DRAFT_943848 [Tulosesus angulatus]